MTLTLHEFNQLDTPIAQSILQNCVHIPSWIDTLLANRPYISLAELYQTAQQQSQTWQWDEVKNALDQHPRIGQKQAVKALSKKEQRFSVDEQGALELTDSIAQALQEGNRAYEDKFGYIFLIRAKGRPSNEILAELTRRLHNSPEYEQVEVTEQLAQIALLRLQQEITE